MRKYLQWHTWQALFELLLASSLWGFGFVATRWALEALNANELTLMRFVLAAVVGFPFMLTKAVRREWKFNLRMSFIPAVLLFLILMFQTWGMNYTTATKSGFITTLYVVFVPLSEALLSRRPMPRALWLCVAGALLGTALITGLTSFSAVNLGDWLTLVCAVFATAQILWLGRVSPKIRHAFAFNIYQSCWAGLFCLPVIQWPRLAAKMSGLAHWPPHAWLGLVSLALGSTVIAFFLQVRAQRRLPPTVSSLIFLLESPFAWIFAMIFLNESFHGLEGVGAALIFASALAATWIESKRGSA